ncbi:MAG: glycosyl hydrolase [Bacteroidota bacterium]
MNHSFLLTTCLFFLFITSSVHDVFGQIIPVGSGSYTTNFPGVDVAGRNTFPSGMPFTTGPAATRTVPTNDWWSAKIKNPHADNLFTYPYTLKTVNQGLVVTYIPWGVIDAFTPITVGVSGLNASEANVSDFTDWTVSMDWQNGVHHFQATAGIGMPFLYFTKDSADIAQVKLTSGTATISNEMLIITDAHNGADFVVYAPVGSSWSQNGNTYSSTLNGKNYWSMAFIPLDATSVSAVANEYKQYAYVFPRNTTTTWQYDPASSLLTTDFEVETEVMEGNDSSMLMGLLPHQWSNLSISSPIPSEYSYTSIRGELKTLKGNHFQVANSFHGILPTLPYLDYYSSGFSPQKMNEKVQSLTHEGLSTWTDSYNEGQSMNRLIQSARIADLTGDIEARNQLHTTIKTRLEDWLAANAGEVAFLFYYNTNWTSLIGYPAGHGQDGNLNDHHFHWGYFIHAASFVEQFEPGWANQWGEMINLLIRDAASDRRDDALFPFLRNFSPYAGHCWANGFATFPQGNDQESTSESMQFNSSLIHWGTMTGNDSIRDLGIYLYTTEQSAIEEYWFDMHDRVFQPSQQYSLISRLWGNSYDNGTFWTNDIAASYGIELYPIHGGSLYLGHDSTYVSQLWQEIEANTGILTNEVNPNLWHDIMWEYLAFIDPVKAIGLYDSYPDRSLKFGVSDAQTYHWLHAMNVLGRVETSVTADHALAAVFKKDGELTYVAHNYQSDSLDVSFSDGYVLQVPPQSMSTSKDISLRGTLSSSFDQAYANGSVELQLSVEGGTASKIEFVDGETVIGQLTQAPYIFRASDLAIGRHHFYARIYDGSEFTISNAVAVIVGEQQPFLGNPVSIPGSIQAAYYDLYEGGIGQGISYQDIAMQNNGDFRLNEYVDASLDASEGGVVGWIAAGEWLEYSIEVQQAGLYSLSFRYACGNSNGGGPFRIESDGDTLISGITVTYSGNWDAWTSKTVANVPLKSGRQVLRLYFEQGELNLGKLTWTYSAPLPYDQPIAEAGENILVLLPQDSGTLDGSNSVDPGQLPLSYSWTQIYGPSDLVFSDSAAVQPMISALVEGVYLVQLKVDNGMYSDEDEVYIISSLEDNVPPTVSIISPFDNTAFIEGDVVSLSAVASDLIGTVDRVEFFANNGWIGTVNQQPYDVNWIPTVGDYDLTAVAYDNDSSASTSESIHVRIDEAPSCIGTSYNGDFSYEFSPDNNNPTITFIPSAQGVGNPTCILYYGTNTNTLPGYPVTPNVPYQITASEGSLIYFYYTYSYPGEVERNNSANKDSYVIGSCRITSSDELAGEVVVYYPNPVKESLHLQLPEGSNKVQVYDMLGQLMTAFQTQEGQITLDMSQYASGMYLFHIKNKHGSKVFKVMR